MASKAKIIKSILDIVEPHFYDSGFNKSLDPSKGIFGPKRPLRVFRPGEDVLFDGYVLQKMVAISEDGPITDAYGGGCFVESFDTFPVEDLNMLLNWAKKFNFKKA